MASLGNFALSQAGRAFLATYLDPRKALRCGRKRLTGFLQRHYRLPLDPDRVDAIFRACEDAVAFYEPIRKQGTMPFDEDLLQEEMIQELEQLERDEALLKRVEKQVEAYQKELDPHGSFVSLPGIRHILGGGIQSVLGDIDRFASLTDHRGYAGFYPISSATGNNRATGTSISKASCNRYKRYLFMAAQTAYQWDVEMAAFYHKRRASGHTHVQAVCAVANGKLIPRIHAMLKKMKSLNENKPGRSNIRPSRSVR